MLKSPEGDDLHVFGFTNLILSHYLKRLFDKPFLSAVVSKGCNFSRQKFCEIFYGYKNRIWWCDADL